MAASRLKRPARHFPSLASRLRVAINASPIKPGPVEAASNTAAEVLRASATPRAAPAARGGNPAPGRSWTAGRCRPACSWRRRCWAGRRHGGGSTRDERRPDVRPAHRGFRQSAPGRGHGDFRPDRAALSSDHHRTGAGSRPSIAPPDSVVPELAQHGRGRLSSNPFQIPLAGWKDILWRTYQQIDEDRLLATAAGVVFFGLLAVFPAITALVSSYGLFADASTIGANLQTHGRDAAARARSRSCRTRSRACLPRATPRWARRSCSASGSPSGAPMPASRP